MSKEVKGLLKGIGGILFFYGFQLLYQLVFLNILKQDNFIINNILYLVMGIILCTVCVLINIKRLKNDYNDFNNNYKKYLSIGLKYWLVSIFIMMISNIILSFITNDIASNEENNRLIMDYYPIYMILYSSILAPIIEELTFRVNFREAFKNDKLFIIITSLIFAGIHVFSGGISSVLSNPSELLYFVSYGSVSVALALSLVKTDNIYTSIIIHSLHNTLSVILIILAGAV